VVIAGLVWGLVAWWSATHKALPQASCGWVGYDGGRVVGSQDPGALTCFNADAQACKPGSIGLHEAQADTTTSEVYTIVPGGSPCQVADTSQEYFVSLHRTGPVTTESCHVAAVTGNGVTLSCSGQDVLIPARSSAPVTPSTGPPRPGPAPAPAAARSG
jgi:hypothetical protein